MADKVANSPGRCVLAVVVAAAIIRMNVRKTCEGTHFCQLADDE
jgi:hypothetical protein